MSGTDPHIHKLFHHVRKAIDVLEEMLSRDPVPRASEQTRTAQEERRTMDATASSQPAKLAYTLNEVRELVSISRSAIYLALGARDLRAVKCGRKTLILARDLHAWLDKLPAKS